MEDSKLAKGLKCSQYQKYCGDCFPQSAVCPVIFSSCDVYTCFVIPGTCFSRNLPCFTLNTSRNVPTSMFYYTPQDDNTSKMSITWTQRCLGMERCKNDRAKGRLGTKSKKYFWYWLHLRPLTSLMSSVSNYSCPCHSKNSRLWPTFLMP